MYLYPVICAAPRSVGSIEERHTYEPHFRVGLLIPSCYIEFPVESFTHLLYLLANNFITRADASQINNLRNHRVAIVILYDEVIIFVRLALVGF